MKNRLTIWLDEGQIEKIKKMVQVEDYKNESKFIGQAVEFYLGYLSSQNSTKYISNILLGEMQGLINGTENRLCRMMNETKITTKVLQNILEVAYEIDDDTMNRLINKARKGGE